MESGRGEFGPKDRIGQLTMRNLDITDTRQKIDNYRKARLLKGDVGGLIPKLGHDGDSTKSDDTN
jgi:argininosuccinate synthase